MSQRGGDLTFIESTVTNNSAGEDGGAVLHNGGLLSITDVRISRNSTGPFGDGGAVMHWQGPLAVNGATISENSAGRYGGGIISWEGPMTISDSTISGNSAGLSGGGIISWEGRITISDSTISGNSAGAEDDEYAGGGGIMSFSDSLTITDSTISGNWSGALGGGIEHSEGDLTITNSTISGNSAAGDGGAIMHISGPLTANNVTISGNWAGGSGGGVRHFDEPWYDGSLTLANATISNNFAGDNGGGIANSDGPLMITNSTITDNCADSDDDASGLGGGIHAGIGAESTIHNTIIAGNTRGTSVALDDVAGAFEVASSHNLVRVGDGSTGLTDGENGNQVGSLDTPIDPMLSPLGDHGGPTQTLVPGPGSPAIDAGSNDRASDAGLTTDQRGAARVVDGDGDGTATVDIGAVEVWGPVVRVHVPWGSVPGPVVSVRFEFSYEMDTSSFSLADDIVSFAGPAGTLAATGYQWWPDSRTLEVSFPAQIALGEYEMVIGPDILNAAGLAMNQDGNVQLGEVPGDRYAATFRIAAPRIAGHTPSEIVRLPIDHLDVTFTQPIDPDTFTADDIFLWGPSGQVSITAVEPADKTAGEETYTIRFPTQQTDGGYRLSIGPDILGANGYPIDQDEDGVAGEPIDDVYHGIFTLHTVGPRITRHIPAGDLGGQVDHFDVWFSEAIDEDTFAPDDVSIEGPDGPVVPASVTEVGFNRFRIGFSAQTTLGQCDLRVGPNVEDLARNLMDQDRDGQQGETPDDVYKGSCNLVNVDLTLSNPSVGSPELWAGELVNVSWEGHNAMEMPLFGDWTDAVYFSADDQWDINDALLATVPHRGGLEAGQPYSQSVQVLIPGALPGVRYLIVRTDLYNQILEGDGEANNFVAAGPIPLSVRALDADGVPVGGTFTVTDGVKDHVDYYAITVAEGEHLQITLDDANDLGHNELYVRYGELPTQTEYDYRHGTNAAADQKIDIPDAQAGVYYVMVYGDYMPDAPSAFTISASLLEFGVYDVMPRRGGNTGNVTITITGAHLPEDPIVHLVSPDETVLEPLAVFPAAKNLAYATFNLASQATGWYDVRVGIRGGGTSQLSDIFEIAGGTGARLEAHILAPSAVRARRAGAITIAYTNTGDTDMVSPYLILESNGNGVLKIGSSTESWDAIALPAIDVSRLPGILPPQAGGTITLSCEAFTGDVNLQLVASESTGELGLPLSLEGPQEELGPLLRDRPTVGSTDTTSDQPSSARKVMVTFDDVTTHAIFDLIEAAQELSPGLRMAFFLNMVDKSPEALDPLRMLKDPGQGIMFNPEVMEQLLEDGHMIGYHGFEHLTGTLGEDPDDAWGDYTVWRGWADRLCSDCLPPGERVLGRFPGWDASRETQDRFTANGIQLVGGYGAGDTVLRWWDLHLNGFGRGAILAMISRFAVGEAEKHFTERPDEPFVLVLHQDFVRPDDLKYILRELQRAGYELADFAPEEVSGYPKYDPSVELPDEFLVDTQRIALLRAWDPNEKVGPAGYGQSQFTAVETGFPYTVHFENDPELANAPAQEVRITDTLEEDLDLSTFELTEIAFADHVIDVPAGMAHYKTTIDLRPEGNPLLVQIEAGLNPETREVTVRLTAVDPNTGVWPEDPMAGFLYPNDQTGQGEGHVSYLVKPLAGLPSGTQITNKASIFFDYNDPIETPLVLNTIDAGTPTRDIEPFSPPEVLTNSVEVCWTGEDDANGSGIAGYDVYYRMDDDDDQVDDLYVRWLENTPETCGVFTGLGGHTYSFYSVAIDNVGHREAAPETRDAYVALHSKVLGRHVFYNNSAFDGNNPVANELDDGAIAVDKSALMPGETATFANYTSYAAGINGVIVDIAGLTATPAADDFQFRVGNDNDPGNWPTAPPPSQIAVRPGDGVDEVDRVTIVWADNAIHKQWLQVTVLSTERTGLPQPDVFYFGNAVGECGNSSTDAKVDAFDMLAARDNPHDFLDPGLIDDLVDFNRDKRVNATDMLIARNNATHFLNALRLITVPPAKVEVQDIRGLRQQPAHDTILRQAARSSGRQDATPAKLDWLYEFEPLSARRQESAEHSPSSEAFDRLLAVD